MSAVLIDFATRRPWAPVAWRPLARGRLSLDERTELRRRWHRQRMLLQAATHEHQALDLRWMLEPADSPARDRLRDAFKIAAEAEALAWESLMCTPAPSAEAPAWKKRQRDPSPEAERVMIEDEAWLEAINGRKRQARRARL